MTTMELEPFALRLDAPFRSAGQTIEERRGISVRLTDGGVVGVGEATPLPGWTESFDRCQRNLAAAVGQDGTCSHLPASPAARHGLQLARLDLAARREECSLSAYCSHESIPAVIPCQTTIGNADRPECVTTARRAVDDGASVLKCKVGDRPISEEQSRLRALREAVGDGIELRLDANRAWSGDEADRIWPLLTDLDIAYVEEPLADPSPDAFDALSGTGVGIALDETIIDSTRSVARWLPHVDVVILKPMALGGFDRALSLGMCAASHRVTPVVSGTIDGVIARTAGVHLAAILPGQSAAGLGTGSFLATDPGRDPAPLEAGSMRVPVGPGIGTDGQWEGA